MSTFGINDSGPLVVETDVDEAIIAVFREWLPTYFRLLGEERGVTLPMPRSYANTLETDEFLDNQLPAVIVTTAKTTSTIGGPNNYYEAMWGVTISCVVRGRRGSETRRTAALCGGAIRRCFLNRCRQNNGPLSDPSWLGSEVMPVPEGDSTDRGRFLAAGIGKYNVATDRAVQGFGGPDVPDADSYVPLAKVTDVVIGVESEE